MGVIVVYSMTLDLPTCSLNTYEYPGFKLNLIAATGEDGLLLASFTK